MLLGQILGPDGLIVVVVAVVVLLFGGAKLPKLARGLGSASHEFKKGLAEGHNESETTTGATITTSTLPASEKPHDTTV